MIKIFEGKLPVQKIRAMVNNELQIIAIPCDDVYTIYEQSGQLYSSVNGNRPIPIY